MIVLDDVSIAYPSRMLVREVHATLRDGEFVAILGPNGVGKTTLMRALCGLHATASGTIVADGKDVAALTPRERARRIAFVTSDEAMDSALRVNDIVATGRYAYHAWWQWRPTDADDDAVRNALAAVSLTGDAHRFLTTLSSGERQRAWIAMGLAQEARTLLLDEPTSHLDVRVAHEILALLKACARAGQTVVCVLHDLNDAATYADRLMLLGCERMLAFGSPSEVLTPDSIERAYGIRVERIETAHGPRIVPLAQ